MIQLSTTNKKLLNFVWIAALISLPITSFPLFTNLTGAIVTPLSAIPIFILMIIIVISMRKGIIFPVEMRFY